MAFEKQIITIKTNLLALNRILSGIYVYSWDKMNTSSDFP